MRALEILIRHLGPVDYQTAYSDMQAFTAARTDTTEDEIWVLQHAPVYTLGLGARDGHVHSPGDIPIVKTDRGGQVTYHGPGQLIAYILIDLRRRGYGVRNLVSRIEQALIETVSDYGLLAARRRGKPGVYVNDAKIAALGLRVKNGCSYHGLALNVEMDLEPFSRIDPCGYTGLAVTQLRELGVTAPMADVAEKLVTYLTDQLECEVEHMYSQPTTMETIAHD
ncbi:MAG: lipoyl(octanoyl) transferase LipB [Gammaproteobacteria bacterium]|nr:lipoyl(octanoyl) transferase LipB [Gammaproteobacteria bacterium]